MAKKYEINNKELCFNLDFIPMFDTTLEISQFKDMIGQERAIEAIDIGLEINENNYNIFVCGDDGTGKKNYVLRKTREFAKKMSTPLDWCYVYNFKDGNKPLAISLNPGSAEEFKGEIDELIDELFEEVPQCFSDREFEKERNQIIDKYQKKILDIVDELYEKGKNFGFNVKGTNEGFAFIPLKDGEEISEKQYSELSEEEKEEINNSVSTLKLSALDIIRESKLIKKNMNEALKELDDRTSTSIIDEKIKRLQRKYGYNNKIVDYLESLKDDIVENIDVFIENDDTDNTIDEDFYKRYYVNIMVCNKELNGAPVVFEGNPEYHNLIGIVEHENKQGNLVTDFTMIQPGSFHKANGGILVIEALQLLKSFNGWDALKKSIKNNKVNIENLRNQFDLIPIVGLQPEEIPLNVKVILIGTPYIYYLLYNLDDEFKEIFKIKADFEDELKNTSSTVMKLLGYISNFCYENKISPITRDGVVEIIKYAARLSGSKKYFTSSLSKIVDAIIQSSYRTKKDNNKDYIDKQHIKAAIKNIERRHGLYRDKILDMYRDGKYIVNLKNCRIGEINGLSVINYGDFSFGRQERISVATYAGTNGVINIERETKMSGNIHSKGIMILSGYIGETYGQNYPVSFNAQICFEQLYGEIDGDSASAAELIALMSSLGDIPIKQSIALTGSVNQKGEIQPVGGINEKIEGFFDICGIYGLDGSHGVIIPYLNLDELVLKDEVIEAVGNGLFHIYAVKSIDECFEILCQDGFREDERRKGQDYIRESINRKLDKYRNSFSDKKRR